MSEIFEKTLASLPGLLNSTLSGNGQLPSRSFQSFIKTFSNIGSKYVSLISYPFIFSLHDIINIKMFVVS